MKYTISDQQRRLEIAADTPEAAAQEWADNFDWMGLMVAFNRCIVHLGETAVGEFVHGRFDLADYRPYVTLITAKWNPELGRYEIADGHGEPTQPAYVSEDGHQWQTAGPDSAPQLVNSNHLFGAEVRVQLQGGPKGGTLST